MVQIIWILKAQRDWEEETPEVAQKECPTAGDSQGNLTGVNY